MPSYKPVAIVMENRAGMGENRIFIPERSVAIYIQNDVNLLSCDDGGISSLAGQELSWLILSQVDNLSLSYDSLISFGTNDVSRQGGSHGCK